jgi:hypothetical protein
VGRTWLSAGLYYAMGLGLLLALACAHGCSHLLSELNQELGWAGVVSGIG